MLSKLGTAFATLLFIVFVTGQINAVPLYDDNFDILGDTEFVPLEEQARTERPIVHPKPYDIDAIAGNVGVPDNNFFFQQAFPFFGNDFFNSFGGFGIGAGPQEPWWKGPNVCTDKKEDETASGTKDEITDEIVAGSGTEVQSQNFGQFHFSVNSCNERPNKHVCTKIVNQNGKKKTLTITRQCCYGYGRPRNADFATPCEKIEIKDIEATAEDMGAKQFIATAKSGGELADMLGNENGSAKKITIFAPIDSAFTNYNALSQGENNMVESKAAEDTMKQLYRRHTVDGEIILEDIANEKVVETQLAGQTIRINAYQMPPALNSEPYRYAANCVPIEKHDKLSQQALVHTLGGVLKPIDKNVMDLIRERADMSIMRTVLEKTKLSEILEREAAVTIFVPNDAAFDKLDPHLRRALKEGKGCASNILKNHMLDLTFCSLASVAGAKTTAYNLLGEALRFNRSAAAKPSTQSEVDDLLDAEQPVLINGKAKIIEADIMGTNGVMHVLDTILPTQTALPISTLLNEKNVTIFKGLLEASGLDDTLDDLDNITVFAPTDKALQGTQWAQLLTESPEKLKNNAELLEFLNYHVAKPMIKTCDLTEQLLPTVGGGNVRINLYSTHALFSDVMNRATVNCARLVHFDDESCGSVLHQVDKVLSEPKMNLLELLESNQNYSKFLELVRAANLTELLTNAKEDYTLLVPKNDVFEEFESFGQQLTQNKNELEQLVKTHIVNDVVCCAGIIPTNWPFVRSIEALTGQHLRITRDRRPKIENAGVTKCDTIATNGIVHEINDIVVAQRQRQRRPQPLPSFGDHHQGDFENIFF